VGPLTEVEVEIDAGAAADNEERAELTGRLRSELVHLDVDRVELAHGGHAPTGAKAADALAIGALIVHLASVPGALGSLTAHVRDWLRGQNARSIKLTLDGDTLELTGASSREQDRLIELWVARHAGSS
jgi:hypothetical protein